MPENLDFLILEINEETMYSPENYFPIYQEKFECLCNVTYSEYICQKHADSPKFLFNIFDISVRKCSEKIFVGLFGCLVVG